MDQDQPSLPSEDIQFWINVDASDYTIRDQMLQWLDKLFKSVNDSNEQIASLKKRIEELEKLANDEIDNPAHPKFGWSKSV